MKTYRINEWFYSLQGEGVRAGIPSLFLRFSGCNLKCRKESEGFDCDTEFASGENWTTEQIIQHLKELNSECRSLILTGGEPTLQIDEELILALKSAGYFLAIETNGTHEVPRGIDWITVSPKTAEHAIRQTKANEVKYVRSFGMGIPKTQVSADHYLISPASDGDQINRKNLDWCMRLVRENPHWRLSIQMHKIFNIR